MGTGGVRKIGLQKLDRRKFKGGKEVGGGDFLPQAGVGGVPGEKGGTLKGFCLRKKRSIKALPTPHESF